MTNLFTAHKITKSYGSSPLFANLSFGMKEGDKLAIIGPNGAGKSTLLKIIAGKEDPDDGDLSIRKGLPRVYVPQVSEFAPGVSVKECLENALQEHSFPEQEKDLKIKSMLSKFEFSNPEFQASGLSGGWKKRLSIACALIQEPELLLLDEPTNHLDLEGILWLEKLLNSSRKSIVLISHDRYFLNKVCNRVLEINRIYPQGMLLGEMSYSKFLEHKDNILKAESEKHASLENKLRRENEWLKQGVKARTTKQQARIDATLDLQKEVDAYKRRSSKDKADFSFQNSDRKTKKLLEIKNLEKSFGDKTLFKNFSLLLSQGMKWGLLGSNASGKSTFLKILSGEIEEDEGALIKAPNLRIVYFEQGRESLDPTKTLKQSLSPEGDQVIYRDRSLHIVTWARKFRFRADQLDTPISKLSGGEQARVLMAKLILQPADLLLLDEPTNDLDIETLEVLEESLLEFPGALLLVTHDRFMLDKVSQQLLCFDGKGQVDVFADYAQWQKHQNPAKVKKIGSSGKKQKEKSSTLKKLTWKEKEELKGMEQSIQDWEKKLESLNEQSTDPEIIADPERLQKVCEELKEAQDTIDSLFERWSDLEKRNDERG